MKRVYPLEDRCIDCHLCEVACVVEHSRTRSPLGAYATEGLRFNAEYCRALPDPDEAIERGRPRPLNHCRVDVDPAGPVFVSSMCRHCEEADCILACKNGSLERLDDGRVVLDEAKCVGCWMCILACRYGAITRDPRRKNVPGVPRNGINHHCDLCPERDVPACVSICPTGALVHEDRG